MDDTDFDSLCEGAPPAEAKQLRKLLADWCNGQENSFPVQLVLLTRAQWRAAAMIPRLVDESRERMELKLAEYRQQTAALVQNFSDTAAAKAEALSGIVATHTESMNQAVAKVQAQLTNAQIVAAHIRRELETGTLAWKEAKADYETERQKLEQARQVLDARTTRHDWIWAGLILLGMIAVGVTIGLRITR